MTTTEPASPAVLLDRLAQGVSQSQPDVASDALLRLCLWPDGELPAETFVEAARKIHAAGWEQSMAAEVGEVLTNPDVQPEAGSLWSLLKADLGDWSAGKKLRHWLQAGPAGERAACTWIDELARRGQHGQLVRLATIGEFWLSTSSAVWFAMASALRRSGRLGEGRFWALNWPAYPAAPPAVLLDVAELLRANGEAAEAARVSQRALESPRRDASLSAHECWLAADALLAGRKEEAADRLSRVDPSGFDPAHRLLFTLVTSGIALRKADAAERPGIVTEAQESIGAALQQADIRREPALQPLYRHVLCQIAAGGTLGQRFWAWRRRA